METTTKTLLVESPAFSHNGYIPPQYTCDGENVSPPITVSDIPAETKTLALIMEDPDAPNGTFDHWLLWNIDPDGQIDERTNEGISGINSFGQTGYGGPCPPKGTHRYILKIFALDKELSLVTGENKQSLLEAMENHTIASGQLIGRYSKKDETGN